MFSFSLPRLLRELRSLSQFLPRTLLAILCATPYAGAAFNVQLAWDADPDPTVTGYRLHWADTAGDPAQVLDVGNATTGTISNLQSGFTYNVTVTAYNADAIESPGSNMVVVQDSSTPNQPPTVTLVNPTDGTTAAAPASFVITANASDSDGTIAHVEFYSNGVLLGDIQASPYSFNWQNVGAGSYSLTARAYDNAGASTTSSAVNVVVNTASTAMSVRLTSPSDGNFFYPSDIITVGASASNSNGTVARVEFYANGAKIGQSAASPYSMTWQNPAPGNYTLTASAYDGTGAVATSAGVNVTVGQPFTVAISSPANGTAFNAPATIPISATTSGPVGIVQFFADGTMIGQSNASPFSCTWQNAPAGSHVLTAMAYNGLGGYTGSAPVQITVNAVNAPPTVTLSSPSDGSKYTAPASVTLTANASDSDGSVVRVEFYSNGTMIGQASSSPFTFNWQNVAAGTYQLFARAYDNSGASTSSATVAITVASPAPVITAVTYGGSGCQLAITGTPGATENVYASSDLMTWNLLMTPTNSTGTVVATDSGAASVTTRFYRVTDGGGTSDPAGFTKIVLAAGNKPHPICSSYLGFGLTWPIATKGTITSAGNHTLTDSQATWTDNQFNGASGDFYVELTSGSCVGFTSDIVGTAAASKTLTIADDLSSLLKGGEGYAIRKHRTLSDTFGAHDEAGLKSGASASAADQVQLFNPVTQSFSVYYYQTGASTGGTGWRSSTDAATDASATKIYLDEGVLVSRGIGSQTTLVVTGAVKMGRTMIAIGSNNNLIANVYPAGSVTLANSGLYTGDTTTGLGGGASVTTADEVDIYNGSSFQQYYYQNSGGGGVGWRKAGNYKNDAGGTLIPANAAVYVVRKSGRSAFNWTAAQPF